MVIIKTVSILESQVNGYNTCLTDSGMLLAFNQTKIKL